ncbi:alpha/beta fold hydrolase [Aliiglaciecola sp. CAU 1673]|uniref:YqiA/YcfP family alpha/beta fold hydrolase n=1 Tax=Aliiglaciecola sp. CAU 1673 TaxID=3032595 RepID=UPI0023DB365E|nr:YqiA/YcfP family alpha/beta fold hydrolase [Aliiglaciecola sp. CAU 1673]MDF2180385.1 alpha/beta fold hydrolase [Aliiglaciecola sp. CAU 1673]
MLCAWQGRTKLNNVLIYLHGFLSSPQSLKAQQLSAYVRQYHPDINLLVPPLDDIPTKALDQAEQALRPYLGARIGLVGSSMGGFLATHLANRFELNAVLVNPAVDPDLLLENMTGTHQNPYSGQRVEVTKALVNQLRDMRVEPKHPRRLWLLQQEGDETLDYRWAIKRYQDCQLTLEPGGCHAFSGFERYLSAIIEFLFDHEACQGIAPQAPC